MTTAAIQFPSTPFVLGDALVLLGRRGSDAHGTRLPDEAGRVADHDLVGICVPPAEYYLGLSRWEGTEAIRGHWDVVLYELKKFVRMLIAQNPNALELLWLDPEDYLDVGPVGRTLVDNRLLFRSRSLAMATFTGFARSQLAAWREGHSELLDRKRAAHLVRLLHAGREYLLTGELTVRRTGDRALLLAIKAGEWPLENVRRHAVEVLATYPDAFSASVLPETIDHHAVNRLLTDILLSELVP